MSESEKEEGDFSETDAVETDEEGRPRVVMEALQKGGDTSGAETRDLSSDEEN